MKIDDTYQSSNQITNAPEALAQRKAEDTRDLSPEADKIGRSGTHVDFSNTSVEISETAKMMNVEQTERTDKINEIKAKIEDDSYHVDATEIADKMISE